MKEKTLNLFNDIPNPENPSRLRKEVPEIETTCIPFDELKDKQIVVTGRLFQMERDDFKSWLKEKGAKLTPSVSHHTDLLVVGENPGGVKVTEAMKLDISICYESEFFDKFGKQLTLDSVL